MNLSEMYKLTSLADCVAPTTLEDVAIQMSALAEDADAEAVHLVADDLLKKALMIAVTVVDNKQDMQIHVSEIVAYFNNLKKYYA